MDAKTIFKKFENFMSGQEVTNLGLTQQKKDFILMNIRRMIFTHAALEQKSQQNHSEYNPRQDQPQDYTELAILLKHQYIIAGKQEAEAAALAKEDLLNLISQNPEIRVLTGHPTEILSSAGVDARDFMRETIIAEFAGLQNDTTNLPTDKAQKSVMNFIRNALPPSARKAIGQERRDMKHASEKFFDSIKVERASIRNALTAINADPNINSRQLNLIRVGIWAYDNDGKPELKPSEMHATGYLLTSAVLGKYVESIAELAYKTKNQELKEHCHAMMFKMINSIDVNVDGERSKKENKERTSETKKIEEWAKNLIDSDDQEKKATGQQMLAAYSKWKETEPFRKNLQAAQIPDLFDGYSDAERTEMQARSSEARTLHRKKIKDAIPQIGSTHALIFSTENELQEKVAELNGRYSASEESAEVKALAGDLHEASVCFGARAARGEYRQSAKVYAIAFKYIEELIGSEIGVSGAENVMNFLAENPDKLKDLGAKIRQEAARIRELSWFKNARENAGSEDIPAQHRLQYYFADLVEKLEVVNKDPESCPVLLGAESTELNDAYRMACLYALSSENDHGKVSVGMLIEYEKAVFKWKEMEFSLKNNANYMKLISNNDTLMLAGSDSSKTMGSSGFFYTKDAFYIGTGSAVYRNAIPFGAPPKRTVQGIEHGDIYSDLIAFENEQTRTICIRRKIETPQRKKIDDQAVVTNIGNRAGLVENDQRMEKRIKLRVKGYSEKYSTYALHYFMKHFTQDDIEAAYSYAARPQVRPDYSLPGEERKKQPSWLDIETPLYDVRAIGNGQRARNKFGNLITMAEVSDTLKTNAIGKFTENNLDAAVKLYRSDPNCQEIVNRAVIELSQNQSEKSGWETVAKKLQSLSEGRNISIARILEPNGTASVVINDNKYTFAELFSHKSHKGRNRLSEQLKWVIPEGSNKNLIGELVIGICGAAMDDWESIKCIRAVDQLYARMNHEVADITQSSPDSVLARLRKINPVYADELIFVRAKTNRSQITMVNAENAKDPIVRDAHMVARTAAELMPVTLLTATHSQQQQRS